jgi:hypothetical protein
MLSIIIWSLIWFFLVVGIGSLAIAIFVFLTNNKATPVLWFSQICAVCFVIVIVIVLVIVLVASIAAKGVGL